MAPSLTTTVTTTTTIVTTTTTIVTTTTFDKIILFSLYLVFLDSWLRTDRPTDRQTLILIELLSQQKMLGLVWPKKRKLPRLTF